MLYDPYTTTLGINIPIKKLTVELSKFIALHDSIIELSYEYSSPSEVGMVFITGKTEEEKDIAPWSHPIIVEMPNRKIYVVSDMRPFVRPKSEDILYMDPIANLGGGYMYKIVATLYTALIAGNDKEDGLHINAIEKTLVVGFVNWVNSGFIKHMRIGTERIPLQIVLAHYILCIIHDAELDYDSSEVIFFKISKMLPGANNNFKNVKSLLSSINYNPRSILDLVDNIKTVMVGTRVESISQETFFNVIANTWGGPSANESIAMACEDMAMLTAVFYSAIDPKGFKYSKMTEYLNNNKRNNNVNDFLKRVNTFVKEHRLDGKS